MWVRILASGPRSWWVLFREWHWGWEGGAFLAAVRGAGSSGCGTVRPRRQSPLWFCSDSADRLSLASPSAALPFQIPSDAPGGPGMPGQYAAYLDHHDPPTPMSSDSQGSRPLCQMLTWGLWSLNMETGPGCRRWQPRGPATALGRLQGHSIGPPGLSLPPFPSSDMLLSREDVGP